MLLGREVRELHHDRRTDGEDLIDMLLFDKLLDTYRHHTFLTIRSVVGHDDHLIRTLAHLVFQDNQILRTTGHHTQDTVACCFQGLDDGQHRGYTKSTTCTDHSTVFFDLRGVTQWTHHIGHVVTDIQLTEFHRRETHLLYHQCNRTFLNVCTGNGQWHTLTFLADTYNHEVTGFTTLRNQRSLNFEKENLFRELFFSYDLIHFLFA